MLKITPLTVNFHSPGKSMFVTLTVTSDNLFPKIPTKILYQFPFMEW